MATVAPLQEKILPHTCGRLNDSLEFDTYYAGNTGSDIGVTTIGFGSAKHNPEEWNQSNYTKYYESLVDRDRAVHTKLSATDVMHETLAMEQKVQSENTKKLAARLKDITHWKFELNREISDILSETDLLMGEKRRMEKALRATEFPQHIVTDNLNVRQRRQGIDLVQDEVELCLLKELQIINSAQDLLKRTITEADLQVKRNRDQKENLEMDWSDKKEAEQIDAFCTGLRNEHTCKQFYPGAGAIKGQQSTPESWAQFTHDNIVRAEQERLASIKLRALMETMLIDVSRDICDAADATDAALQRRISETEEAKARLEEELKRVCDTIVTTEQAVEAIKRALRLKEDPMKVAQTRLHQREFKPNVEQCGDPAQFGLLSEVRLLAYNTELLMQKLQEAENDLKALQGQRMVLEKDIQCKKNSLFIDREKCLPHRTRYPSANQLLGY